MAFALVWALLLYYVVFKASRMLATDGGSGLIAGLLDYMGLDRIASWAVPELAVYWFLGLMLLPFFCITLTADQTASDRARGTLRFLLLRSTRWQIYFGRFLGQMFVQALFVIFTALTTLGVSLYRDGSSLPQWLETAPAVMVNLLIVLLPYTALMALVSIMAKSARQATLYAIILWIVFWFLIRYLLAKFPDLDLLQWVMPGSQITSLLKTTGWDALALAPIPLAQTVVLLIIGALIVRRIDL